MEDFNPPELNVRHIMWWVGLNKAEDSSRFGHFGSNATLSGTGSWAFMAMEQPEGSNSNTYRPVFALLQTHLWFTFFSSLICFVRILENIATDKTSQATTSFRADWAIIEPLKAICRYAPLVELVVTVF